MKARNRPFNLDRVHTEACVAADRFLSPVRSVAGLSALALAAQFAASPAHADHDLQHEVDNLKGGLGAVEERVWDLEQQALNAPDPAPELVVRDANGAQFGRVVSFFQAQNFFGFSYIVSVPYLVGTTDMTFLLRTEGNGIYLTPFDLQTEYWQDSGCELMPLIAMDVAEGAPSPAFDPYVIYKDQSTGAHGLFAPSGDPSVVLNQFYSIGYSLNSPNPGQCVSRSGPKEFVPAVEVEADIAAAFPAPFSVERVQ